MHGKAVCAPADAPCRTRWTPRHRPRRCASTATWAKAGNSGSGGAADLPPPSHAAATSGAECSGSTPSSSWGQLVSGLTRRAAAAALAAAVAVSAAATAVPSPAGAVTTEQLLFLEAWRAVDRAYVDKKFNGLNWFKVREDALKKVPMGTREETHAAIKALLASLEDPFTRFLEPDQYLALRRSTVGAVTGIGVEVSFSTQQGSSDSLVVITPAPGGPAERAGIRPGDIITAIDGQPTSTLSLYAAGNMLQGAEGSQVVLTVKPDSGKGAARDVKLTRQPIAFNAVDYALCSSSGRVAPGAEGSKLGYIRVASFSKQTADKVREALEAVKEQGAERLVMDIRNNGGGLFPASVEVGRMLLGKGDIVLIADSDGVRDIYSAEGRPIDPSTPMTVLVNRGTASSSEVLAGALKDNKRATVAGENTFGKGRIQTLIELSDGSAVTVTVARYETPAGIDINTVGITPTIKLTPEQLNAIPLTGEGFCRFAQTDAAPPLF